MVAPFENTGYGMVNMETAQNILKEGGYKDINNDEIKILRDYLYMIGRMQVEIENVNNKN